MGGIMMVRSLVIGALSAAVLTAFAASDAAFAAKKKAGVCPSVDKPQCNLILRADCTKKNRCGGCQKWVCRL